MDIFRTVKGRAYRPNNTAWPKDAFVQIRLLKGSYTIETQFPRCGVSVPIGDLTGDYSVSLWASETGEIPTRYELVEPNGDRFEFVVPAGSGDLQISALRQASQPVTPAQQNAIFAYVDQAIAGIGSGGGYPIEREILNPANSPAFQLTNIPVLPHLSALHINGQKQFYGSDYVINSSILRWNSYTLRSNWAIEFTYYRSN